MDKIDAWQVVWSIVLIMLTYLSVTVTIFLRVLKDLKLEISKKESAENCEKYRRACEEDCNKSRLERARFTHTHGTLGSAGEVIK